MIRYIEMPDHSSFVINNEENEQDLKLNGGNDEEIHSRNNVLIVAEKGFPGLLFLFVRVVQSIFMKVSGDSSLGNFSKSKH